MSSSAAATVGNVPASIGSATWRARLSSLFGFLPLGVWTVNHLWDNLAAFRGAEAWEEAVTVHPHPFAQIATLVIVLLPLLGHTVWGIVRLFSFRPNIQRYPNWGNTKYLLQRLSAIGLLGFLGAHLWLAFLEPRLVRGHAETFADISAHMRHHGPTTMVYVLGVLGIAYHLANGLGTMAFRFGLVSGRKSERRFGYVVYGTFVVLTVMGLGAIYALWDAGAAFPPPET